MSRIKYTNVHSVVEFDNHISIGNIVEKQIFNDLLKKAELSKKEFAALLGTSAGAVSNWGNEDREIPYWVESWMDLYIENMQCKKLKETLIESNICSQLS